MLDINQESDMTMTVEEAMRFVRANHFEGGASNTLAAEVERLRAHGDKVEIERDDWKRLAVEREDAHTRGYRDMTELLAFAERNPWWTLAYLSVISTCAMHLAYAIVVAMRGPK